MPPKKKSVSAENPKQFVLSKSIKSKLPESERATADADLWTKSAGLCSLCGRPLEPRDADADHVVPESAGGPTQVSNLYLAHKTCNQSRGNLEMEVARPVVEFRAFTSERGPVSFDDVIGRYVHNDSGTQPQPVEFEKKGAVARLRCGDIEYANLPVFTDPATGVEYFFADIPVTCIYNDADVQPRSILYNHVRALALDFVVHPVHEPSNCRLEYVADGVARLLQFDGQHKTTAQILLGRSSVPMKVYIAPEKAMVQELVLKIQQEIKKQPLTKSDTLAKLGDVMQRRLEEYVVPPGQVRTEAGFIASQPKSDQNQVKKEYFQELQRLVFFAPEGNDLAKAVRPGHGGAPTTDRVVIEKIIAPLIWKKLLATNLDEAGGRDVERELILLVLNTIAAKMLPSGWAKTPIVKRRAELFFQQGAIAYWIDELVAALRLITRRVKESESLLIGDLDQKDRDAIIGIVEALCDWPIWSTEDEGIRAAIRSNTQKHVKDAMRGYDYQRLVKDYQNRQ